MRMRRGCSRREPARFDRRLISELLEAPALIVPLDELGDGGAHVVEVLKDPAVDCLLLERAIPPFHDAIRFRFLEEAEAGTDAPVSDLPEEVVREVLTAVVHPQRQPAGVGNLMARLLYPRASEVCWTRETASRA